MEQTAAMTSAPYNASRKRRIASSIWLVARRRGRCRPKHGGASPSEDNAMAVEGVDLDRNPVQLAERPLCQDVIDRSDTEASFLHQRDPRDVVRDLVECVTHHQRGEAATLVQLAHEPE